MEILMPHIIAVERDLLYLITAPTLPIYDVLNFPQDAVECQLAIGSDDNLYWYSSGSWQLGDSGSTTVVVNNVPQDIVEGQLVVALDDSGIAWFSNGSWHGLTGSAVSGNTPQDAVEGQLAIGNHDNLCWFVDGQWYST